MKILMVNSLYEPHTVGGAEKVVKIISEELANHGHSVVVLTTQPKGRPTVELINGVKIYYVPIQNIYQPFAKRSTSFQPLKALWHGIDSYNPWMAKAIQNIIETETPDLIHTHNLAGFSVAAWTVSHRLKLPIVHTLHDHYLLCPKSTMFRNGRNCDNICVECRFYAQPRQFVSQKVDAVVGVSNYILSRHLALGYFPNARISQVIFNPYIGPHTKRAYNIQLPIRFGYLGRIHPIKGLETLIKAFANSEHDFRLFIGGTGDSSYITSLKRTESRPNIKWLGFVSPQDLLENIDVLVVPSLINEAAGMVVQEALAMGVPVLGSERGGIPELLGDGGWLFEPNDYQNLTSILDKLTQNPNDIISKSEQAWQRGLSFSADSVLKQYEDLYSSL